MEGQEPCMKMGSIISSSTIWTTCLSGWTVHVYKLYIPLVFLFLFLLAITTLKLECRENIAAGVAPLSQIKDQLKDIVHKEIFSQTEQTPSRHLNVGKMNPVALGKEWWHLFSSILALSYIIVFKEEC